MEAVWNRIESWLQTHAPKIFDCLQPGVSEQQIQETEAFLGVTLPADVKDSYRLHNGQQLSGPSFIDGWDLLSLDEIQSNWLVWKQLLERGDFHGITSEPSGPILSDWWNPRWIPFTQDGIGNHFCLDLSPAPGGSVGQIILLIHDDVERVVLAPSFESWLSGIADDLETGKYYYEEQGNYATLLRDDVA